MNQSYRTYFTFAKYNESYELIAPIVSVHNVIPMMGAMYTDIGETMTVICKQRPYEKCEVKFHRKGWGAMFGGS